MKVKLFFLCFLMLCAVGCGFEEYPATKPTKLQQVTQAQTSQEPSQNKEIRLCDDKLKKKIQDLCKDVVISQMTIPAAPDGPETCTYITINQATFDASKCKCTYTQVTILSVESSWICG